MPEGFISLTEKDLNRYLLCTRGDADNLSSKGLEFILAMIEHLIYMDGYRALFFYRLQQSSSVRRYRLLRVGVRFFNAMLNRIELDPRAEIGAGCVILHGQCIVVGFSCILGENVTIHQGVTIGAIAGKVKNGRVDPIIEDGVMLGAGAKVLGPVRVGKNSIIGANAIVLDDIPANSIAVGVPAKVVRQVYVPFEEVLRDFHRGSGRH